MIKNSHITHPFHKGLSMTNTKPLPKIPMSREQSKNKDNVFYELSGSLLTYPYPYNSYNHRKSLCVFLYIPSL